MTVERLAISELSPDWQSTLAAQSLLASPSFLQLWRAVGGREVVWVARDRGQVVVALPGVEFRPAPLTRFQAMPDGLYLRLIRRDSSVNRADRLEQLLSRIARHGYARVYLTDYFRELGEAPRLTARMLPVTVIELKSDWEPTDAKLRSEIRKAEREGLDIRMFNPATHMPHFLDLMRRTESRHGRRPKYPDQFFAELAHLAESDDRIRWYYVENDGRPVASHIYLVEQATALNWQIYFDKQFASLKANQSMLYHAARQFQARGVQWLNLGITPGDAAGVKAFKDKWGGRSIAYPLYERRSLLGRLI